jgi:hypothetical protein
MGRTDTGGQCNGRSDSCSLDDAKSKRMRGRSLSPSATASRSVSVTVEKSKPLANYCLRSALRRSSRKIVDGETGSSATSNAPMTLPDFVGGVAGVYVRRGRAGRPLRDVGVRDRPVDERRYPLVAEWEIIAAAGH